MTSTDEIKKNLKKNRKLFLCLTSAFNLLMLFLAACIAKLSKHFALVAIGLWFVLLVWMIVLNRKINKDAEKLKNADKE